MTYEAALLWKEQNLKLIGTSDEKGFVVSDLFIVPSNPTDRDVFLRQYLFTENKDTAILPFVGGDFQVWSVDLNRLESNNILFYNVLAI